MFIFNVFNCKNIAINGRQQKTKRSIVVRNGKSVNDLEKQLTGIIFSALWLCVIHTRDHHRKFSVFHMLMFYCIQEVLLTTSSTIYGCTVLCVLSTVESAVDYTTLLISFKKLHTHSPKYKFWIFYKKYMQSDFFVEVNSNFNQRKLLKNTS